MSATPSPPTQSPDHAHWFAEEVQPHEDSLRSYLRGSFPSVRDIDDLVQESYLRLLKARATTQIRLARAFLFSVARRLAIDHIRRSRTAEFETVLDSHAARVLDEAPGVAEIVSRRQEAALLAQAIDSLPRRCREIVILRKLDDASHRDIAVRLRISEETVQVQIGRGMHKIAKFLRRYGMEFGNRQSNRREAP